MKLTFQKPYKSIRAAPAVMLPDFVLMTGENGAGKTQFLQAIARGDIQVEGVRKEDIRYADWQLSPSGEGVSAGEIVGAKSEAWNNTQTWLADLQHRFVLEVIGLIGPFRRSISLQELLHLPENELANVIELRIEAPRAAEVIRERWVAFKQDFQNANPHVKTIWAGVERISGRPVEELSEAAFFNSFPLAFQPVEPLRASFTRLFLAYRNAQMANRFRRFLKEREGENVTSISDDEFNARFGTPPWETLDEFFRAAELPFQTVPPPVEGGPLTYEPKVRHLVSEIELPFSDLSSGQKVLASIALYLYFSAEDRQPKKPASLLLLDEIDAPLHPNMARALLRSIRDVVVGKHGVKVIMATHVASTVAMAPEESVYVMAADRTLRHQSRDAAIKALTVGVPTLSVRIENRRQVFVEAADDVRFYEKIASLLGDEISPEITLDFIPAEKNKGNGCDAVALSTANLTKNGNPTIKGLVDWDGHRKTVPPLYVLGEDKRYSLENYIFDPILVAALVCFEAPNLNHLVGLSEEDTLILLPTFKPERLQTVSDAVVATLDFETNGDCIECSYCNGVTLSIPRDYLQAKGHIIFDRLKAKFGPLGRFRSESDLRREVIEKYLPILKGFIPIELRDLLEQLQA